MFGKMSELLLGYILFASLTCITWILILANRQLMYWRLCGVTHSKPHLLFGNLLGKYKRRKMCDVLVDYYEKFRDTKAPFCAFYFLMEPAALILDSKLAIDILTKEKEHFRMQSPYGTKVLSSKNELAAKSLEAFKQLEDSFSTESGLLNVTKFSRIFARRVFEMISMEKLPRSGRKNMPLVRKLTYAFQHCFPQKCRDNRETLTICSDVSASLLTLTLLKLSSENGLQIKLRTGILDAIQNFETEVPVELTLLNDEISANFNNYAPYSHVLLRAIEDYKTNRSGYTIHQGGLVIIPNEVIILKDQVNRYSTVGSFEKLFTNYALTLCLKNYEFSTSKEIENVVNYKDILPHKILSSDIYLSIRKKL